MRKLKDKEVKDLEVECLKQYESLLSKREALNSNPSTTQKKKKS
jgi:hypothetical protein